jgi:hypothetical protein
MKTKWTEEEKNLLIKNYPKHGLNFCLTIINRPKNSISDKAHELKLKVNKESLKEIKKIALKGINKKTEDSIFKVDHKQFKSVDKKEVAYLLGFLWADGYIGANKEGVDRDIWMYLVEDDMKNLKHIFNKTGKWGYYYRKQKNGKPQIGMHVSNRFLCEFLNKNNFSNKLLGTDILKYVDNKLHSYFLLGLIDGDGNFFSIKNKIYTFNIVSGYEQNWKFIESIFKNLNIEYHIQRMIQKNGHKFSRIIISNKEDVKKLGNFIYENFDNDNIGLKRKYEKFLIIKNS